MEGLCQRKLFGHGSEVPSVYTSPTLAEPKQPCQRHACSTLWLLQTFMPIRYATRGLSALSAVSSEHRNLATATHPQKGGLHA